MLRVHLRHNLAVMTFAMINLFRSVRGGYGRISLSALARCLPTRGNLKTRFKRLSRLLANKHLCPEAVVPALVSLVVGVRRALVPILVDQTEVAGTPTLMAGVIHRGRVLPIGFTCFNYPKLRRSQNTLETALLQLIIASLAAGVRAVFTADRQYGRLQLIQALNRLGQLYILRRKSKVILWYQGRRLFPRQFPRQFGVPVRYENIRYRADGQELVDLIVYRERRFKQAWYLLVPAGTAALLPTALVVKIYRGRMQIEQGFRDWKSHLGVRGLKLKIQTAERLCRLLLALTLAYICVLLLGSSPWAQRYRCRFETIRPQARHGTQRTLSVLSLGMLVLGTLELFTAAQKQLLRIIAALTEGRSAYSAYSFAEAL
jgi:hypothetical protein